MSTDGEWKPIGNLFEKWQHVAECSSWIHNEGRQVSEVVVLHLISQMPTIQYKPDKGKDFWQTPESTKALGHGDCEDIAILQMQYLNKFGVALCYMSIVVCQDYVTKEMHAVLKIDCGDSIIYLDCRFKGSYINENMFKRTYYTYYEIGHQGWRDLQWQS